MKNPLLRAQIEEIQQLSDSLESFLYGGSSEKVEGFRSASDVLFNRGRDCPSFIPNPVTELIVKELAREPMVSIAGCPSSSKTNTLAMWSVLSLAAAPDETQVVFLGSDLKDMRMRIWGRVMHYWSLLPSYIKDVFPVSDTKQLMQSKRDSSGMYPIPVAGRSTKEVIKNLIGWRAQRLIVICDDLEGFDAELIDAASANLPCNPRFQFIFSGTPGFKSDAFGVFSEPKSGGFSGALGSVSWDTNYGRCLRMPASRVASLAEDQYPFLMTEANLTRAKQRFGEDSALFRRLYLTEWVS